MGALPCTQQQPQQNRSMSLLSLKETGKTGADTENSTVSCKYSSTKTVHSNGSHLWSQAPLCKTVHSLIRLHAPRSSQFTKPSPEQRLGERGGWKEESPEASRQRVQGSPDIQESLLSSRTVPGNRQNRRVQAKLGDHQQSPSSQLSGRANSSGSKFKDGSILPSDRPYPAPEALAGFDQDYLGRPRGPAQVVTGGQAADAAAQHGHGPGHQGAERSRETEGTRAGGGGERRGRKVPAAPPPGAGPGSR